MPKLLIFDAFTLLIRKKNVAIYALSRCKIFSLKIWVCKILDKFHVCTHRERLMGCSVPKPEGSMQTPAEALHAVAQQWGLVAPTLHISPPVLPTLH